jgi:hypothetical protein
MEFDYENNLDRGRIYWQAMAGVTTEKALEQLTL